jgi:hypothetical protein
MPCTPVIARLLLRQGKAICVKRMPFTIKLLYQTTNYTQNITLGVDTGSSKIGSSAVDEKGNILYLSEVEIRNDITDKMTQRAKYRRNRRNRKTRYRQARWLNRRNSIKKGRFSPTMRSKFDAHLREVKFVKSILPVTKLIIETATFDTHALKNPKVLSNKWLYQKGINYGFANTKAYVLNRDNHTCQHCKGKTKDSKLEVHHIIFKRNGGSDEQDNLITLCKTCHNKLHDGDIALKGGKIKGQLKHATQMNSIRTQLLRFLPEAEETFGFITKEHRQLLNLPKEHYIDAVVIACQGNNVNLKTNQIMFKKCVSDGDYKQTYGSHSEKRIPTGKIMGFRKFDKVKYLGREYFIKGRMSSGFAILMDIKGKKNNFDNAPKGRKTPKLNNMKRIGSRKTWIIQAKTIQNIY